ncbi:MAG TPA: hypothetical protein VGV67_14350 [Solirubrobacteraceae bacterium]|nr:hypothetical protein [Solirubrobacteraceae bacterium]
MRLGTEVQALPRRLTDAVPDGPPTPGDEPQLRGVVHVHSSRDGKWWTASGESLEVPPGWEFLPAGDAYATKTVKRAGEHWVVWETPPGERPRGAGVWAPAEHVRAALAAAQARAAERAARADPGERPTLRSAQPPPGPRFGSDFERAIHEHLGFAPEHDALAREIARDAARRAIADAVAARRRWGMTLAEKAERAARAELLQRLAPEVAGAIGQVVDDDLDDVEVAHRIEAFLDDHRPA